MTDRRPRGRSADVPGPAEAGPHVRPRLLPLVLVCFVGSGAAALMYEIVWFQMIQLVIGATAVSLGVVLAAFILRRQHRRRQHLQRDLAFELRVRRPGTPRPFRPRRSWR
jgi:Flp pilus assembly protein TadB